MKYDEVYGSLEGTKAQGPFQRIPIFDPDVEYENGDLEEGIDLADTRYDRGSSKPIPVRPANRDRTNSFDYSTPYDDASSTPSSGGFKQTSFKKFAKPLRTLSTSSSGSHMQGPRPAPKRSGTLVSISATSPTTPSSTNSGKNKEWFKRFKSKTTETIVDEDEDNDNEGGEKEALVAGSERKRTRTSKKRSDNNQECDGGDADGEDEGLL
ncbi:hypothetical protein Clacol_007135 [Clathrus columnatus]|uniref:Uncharacterized protein n=1 Tax=Clathrus columnatus TaxID=1419009 RepID=A0AAV5AIC5_9AGAM|nr:hypothetical protein Clacol_007135 [Clathrus columnatus]